MPARYFPPAGLSSSKAHPVVVVIKEPVTADLVRLLLALGLEAAWCARVTGAGAVTVTMLGLGLGTAPAATFDDAAAAETRSHRV